MIIIRIGNKRIRFGKDKRRKASPAAKNVNIKSSVKENSTNTSRVRSKNNSLQSKNINTLNYSDMLKFSARIISILTIFSLIIGFTIRLLPTSSKTPKLIANAKRQRGVIYINPAGGGSDTGASNDDRKSKNDNLEIALGVKESLEKKNFKVIISRTSDKNVKEDERIAKANKNEADFMVTIDRDKTKNDESSGINAYVNTNKDLKSQYLAASILNEVNAIDVEKVDGLLHIGKDGNTGKNYTVNAKAKMPSCVIIMGSISSKSDNEIIDKKKRECSEAIANGIESAYYKVYSSGDEVKQENINALVENDFIKDKETDESEESSKEKSKKDMNSNEVSKSNPTEEKKKNSNPDKYDDSEDSYGDLM